MNARQLLNKSRIDIEHMPNPDGINVVRIASLDSEEFTTIENRQRVTKTRHQIWLDGWSKPLGLNNRNLQQLMNLFGEETDNWIGRQIALTIEDVEEFGELVSRVVINRRNVDNAPLTAPIPMLATKSPTHQLAPRNGPFAAGAPDPFTGTKPTTIGMQSAAAILVNLKARGKTLNDFIAHLNKLAMGHLVADKMPFDWPPSIATVARTYIDGFPRTVDVKGTEEVAEFVKSWSMLAPPPAPAPSPPAAPAATRRVAGAAARPVNRPSLEDDAPQDQQRHAEFDDTTPRGDAVNSMTPEELEQLESDIPF